MLAVVVAGAACDPHVHLGDIRDSGGDSDAAGDGPGDGGGLGILWAATFEPGDLSEWVGDGLGGMYMDPTGTAPAATVDIKHRGQYAGISTVTTSTPGVASLSYLYRNQPSPPAAYYSAWFYIPSWYAVKSWLSLSHFRYSRTADGENLLPLWDLNVYPRADGSLTVHLYNYSTTFNFEAPPATKVLTSKWTHFEIYLRKAADTTGQISVYMDGVLIINAPGIATAETDWVQWDAGGSSDNVVPSTAVVYVDDAAISLSRLGTSSWTYP
jgi:hypothetical protein